MLRAVETIFGGGLTERYKRVRAKYRWHPTLRWPLKVLATPSSYTSAGTPVCPRRASRSG
jgi:hypothetical protein